jgi:hypothetical protein
MDLQKTVLIGLRVANDCFAWGGFYGYSSLDDDHGVSYK